MRQGLFVLLLAAVGCAGAGRNGDTGAAEDIGSTSEAMVGGTASGSSQNSVVWVQQSDQEGCSGTFIAPNLVLTARHCVAEPDDVTTTDCVGYSATVDPSIMTIKSGTGANFDSGTILGTGIKIYTPKTVNMCGYDIALIQLANDVSNQKTSPMRFTALLSNEPTIAVGYGVDENNNTLPSRMQRNTTVLGVGPANINYKEEDGTIFNYTASTGDVVTGESTCFGDSGGPLLDMKGNIVAITSRGPLNAPTGGDHGNSCADMISIYAGAKFNEQIIRDAATQAGHPLPADTAVTEAKSSSNAGDDDDSADDDDDSAGDDDDSSSKKKTTSSSSSSGDTGDTIPSSGGCSATPNRTISNGDAWLLGLGLALVVAKSRRKNS